MVFVNTLALLVLLLGQPLWLLFFIGLQNFKSKGEYIDEISLESRRNSECFYRYIKRDHHQSFAEWLHKKNSSHYTPIAPTYQQSLLNLQLNALKDGEQVTHGIADCEIPELPKITPDIPLRERALCHFEYFLNYNPLRVPAALTEVRCMCAHPPSKMIGKRIFECEPLRYQIRVLKFDELCQTYSEQIEIITLACIPVLQATARADGEMKFMVPERFQGPIKKRFRYDYDDFYDE
ncbi:hypothetical protein ACH3XW_1075 [Acanthocheilonema viteae]|uniref:Uncharacterized protein n=1 Tax=Acanthocheilonema viteae TaxID=6277 RepID=A0A498SN90_ACAVI|nr:unnamed protein product [Acanthocheilonema viteae]